MMHRVVRQLAAVRRSAGRLLLISALCQWLSGLIAVAIALGAIDFILRLPVWMRSVMGLALLSVAFIWLIRRVHQILQFKPQLSTMALRAEKLDPSLAGQLASAVEFAAVDAYQNESNTTALLASASIRKIEPALAHLRFTDLINPKPTLSALAGAVLAMAIMMLTVLVAPDSSHIALRRWLTPWSDAQWPRRVSLKSLTTQTVWPLDSQVKLAVAVERGYRNGLRTWVRYRVHMDDVKTTRPKGWQTLLMNEQAQESNTSNARAFERVLDLPELAAMASSQTSRPWIEFQFSAGDDQTDVQKIHLIARPAVESAHVHVEPPPYAAGLVRAQDLSLDQQVQQLASVAALAGSRVTFHLDLSKPVAWFNESDWKKVLPGLASLTQAEMKSETPLQNTANSSRPWLELSFALEATNQTPVRLVDEFGLSSVSERMYRFVANEDRLPIVSVVQPAADETVLAKAVVELQAMARDDVGVKEIWIEAQIQSAKNAGTSSEASASSQKKNSVELKRVAGRAAQLNATHSFDLSSLNLLPGDEVNVFGLTRDVYEYQGKTHEIVRSAPRRLRVIDAATLMGQMQAELATLRQQAARSATRQQELQTQTAQAAVGPQRDLSQQLAAHAQVVSGLRQRMEKNHFEDSRLSQTLSTAAQLLEQSQAASGRAQQGLEAAAGKPEANNPDLTKARNQQQETAGKLSELVALLDQGKDAMALQLQLRQMESVQQSVAAQMRELLPQTLGKSAEQLTPEQKQQLQDLTARENALSQQAQTLSQQMAAAAENLARQSQAANDQAAAQAMAEAAQIAQKQGLSESMQKAAQATKQNQLSQAGQRSQESLETLRQMLDKLDEQSAQERAILKRQLAQLAQVVQRLIEQQQAQLKRLEAAQVLPALEPGLATLRTSTLSAQEMASKEKQTAQAGQLIAQAAGQQGSAIVALRDSKALPARESENQALGSLQAALAKLQEQQKQEQAREARQERKELKKKYEELARKQDELREQTKKTAEGTASRRQRADLVELGMREADLRIETGKLRQSIEKTVLFTGLHEMIDQTTAQISSDLRQGKGDANVQSDEEQVSQTLRAMALALEEDKKSSEQSESGGGEGGGEGQPPPVVPPLAELKLLRQMQETVYRNTRTLAELPENDVTTDRSKQLGRLGMRQRDLSAMAQKLVDKMKPMQMEMPRGEKEKQP